MQELPAFVDSAPTPAIFREASHREVADRDRQRLDLARVRARIQRRARPHEVLERVAVRVRHRRRVPVVAAADHRAWSDEREPALDGLGERRRAGLGDASRRRGQPLLRGLRSIAVEGQQRDPRLAVRDRRELDARRGGPRVIGSDRERVARERALDPIAQLTGVLSHRVAMRLDHGAEQPRLYGGELPARRQRIESRGDQREVGHVTLRHPDRG